MGQVLAQHPPGKLPFADLIAGYARWSRSNPSSHGMTLQANAPLNKSCVSGTGCNGSGEGTFSIRPGWLWPGQVRADYTLPALYLFTAAYKSGDATMLTPS
jgi:hypothetical protein